MGLKIKFQPSWLCLHFGLGRMGKIQKKTLKIFVIWFLCQHSSYILPCEWKYLWRLTPIFERRKFTRVLFKNLYCQRFHNQYPPLAASAFLTFKLHIIVRNILISTNTPINSWHPNHILQTNHIDHRSATFNIPFFFIHVEWLSHLFFILKW